MIKVVGQKAILNQLSKYTFDTFPRSLALIGEQGMGKHTLVTYISENYLKLPVLDISELLSNEYIDAIYRTAISNIYLIDISKMTEKQQNAMLKFIEEPLSNCFIIILAESRNLVLNTVINRCIVFELEAYSKEELKSFITVEKDVDLLLNIIRSPGKLLSTNTKNLRDMLDVCEKIATKLPVAAYSNTLSISSKINYKDEYNKFDLTLFLDALSYTFLSHYRKDNNKVIYELYKLLREQRCALLDKRLNRELFMNNLLSRMWRIARGIS